MLKLTSACSCTKCSHGCTMGSGILAPEDYEKLAKLRKLSVEQLKKEELEEVTQFGHTFHRPKINRQDKPWGQCSYYDPKKGCTVHDAKPLQCTLAMGCKPYGEQLMLWFMHNYLIKEDNTAQQEFNNYKQTGGKTL